MHTPIQSYKLKHKNTSPKRQFATDQSVVICNSLIFSRSVSTSTGPPSNTTSFIPPFAVSRVAVYPPEFLGLRIIFRLLRNIADQERSSFSKIEMKPFIVNSLSYLCMHAKECSEGSLVVWSGLITSCRIKINTVATISVKQFFW